MLTPMLTIEEVATRLGVNRDAVSHWVTSLELPAVNVNRRRNSKRPSWRIRPEDLQAFELSRQTLQKLPPASKQSKPKSTARNWFET